MDETGGLGVDCVIDNGGENSLSSSSSSSLSSLASHYFLFPMQGVMQEINSVNPCSNPNPIPTSIHVICNQVFPITEV